MATVLEQIKELDEQRAKLLNDAKAEALAKVQQGIADLSALGFTYTLAEGGKPQPTTRKGTRQVKDVDCPICKFKTNPPHDKRSHRTQKKKAPFTKEELETRGFKRA